MNKQFKQGFNLLHIGGHYYVTDKDAGIKEHVLVRNGNAHILGKVVKDFPTMVEVDVSWETTQLKPKADCLRVIFTSYPSLCLPLLEFEDEARRLAIQEFPHNGTLESGYLAGGFIIGFKANKNEFSREQILRIIEFVEKYYKERHPQHHADTSELLDLYLKSEERIIDSFEVEYEECRTHKDDACNVRASCCNNPFKPKLNANGKISMLNIQYNGDSHHPCPRATTKKNKKS